MKNVIKIGLFLSFCLGFSQNNLLQSGPMLGYCEMKEAVIWLQAKENATVQIEYFAIDNPKKVFTSDNYTSSKEHGFTYHIVLGKLEPGKKYKYTVYINNKKVVLPYETSFSSKKLWQWREDAPDFTVALGSCNYINEPELDRPGKGYGSGYSIFESINSKNPDIMIWGGDNIYLREADWDSKTGILHRYTHARAIIEMQPLLAKTQNFAIWDDHDYGPNDGDRSFYNKHLTLEAFKDFWVNKSYGMSPAQNEGTYSTFTWGDAQFFLLDDRFFKSPNERKTGERTILGNEQFEWLIDALSSSNASFKIICNGGAVLSSTARFENYATYPEERAKLLKEIEANKIKGVLFLSGDIHFSELSKLERNGTYSLYDWTVSPLTAGASDYYKKENNTNRVAESAFGVNNFGTISFSGNKENRQMKLSLFDNEGKELWNKVILKKELQ
jgi:alkaline phosphatase D